MQKDLIKELILKSPAFEDGEFIPSKYTCEGKNINPPLEISGIPEEAMSFVLMIEDLDASEGIFDHWLVWNIQPGKTIDENSIPGVQGKNSYGTIGYRGPCPPSGSHRYYFKLYALDTQLDLAEGSGKIPLLEAMKEHVITMNEFIGRYQTTL